MLGFKQNYGVLSPAEGEGLTGLDVFWGTDSPGRSWKLKLDKEGRKVRGADGSEKVPEQCIGGLGDSGRAVYIIVII